MKRFFAIVCCVMVLLSGCLSNDQLTSYYADRNNYVTVTGTVSHIQYNEDQTALYIGIEECPGGFSDTEFKLVGEGLTIARETGIEEALQVGDEIIFTCAPRYFGDGYVVPLAAICVDGTWYLDFEVGHSALMSWLWLEK